MPRFINLLFSILFVGSFVFNSGCSTANKNVSTNKDIAKLPKEVPPSVNSVNIEAEITGIIQKGENINCQLKILQVKDYGSSVPPLPVGSIIEASISQTTISNSKLSTEEILKKGLQHNIILEHYVLPPGVAGPPWKILSIK